MAPENAARWELPCDPRRPEPPIDRRFTVGVYAFVALAFAALVVLEIGVGLGWWS